MMAKILCLQLQFYFTYLDCYFFSINKINMYKILLIYMVVSLYKDYLKSRSGNWVWVICVDLNWVSKLFFSVIRICPR